MKALFLGICLIVTVAGCRQSKEKCEQAWNHFSRITFNEVAYELFMGQHDVEAIRAWEPWGEKARKLDDVKSWGKKKILRFLVSQPGVTRALEQKLPLAKAKSVIDEAYAAWRKSPDVVNRQTPMWVEMCHKKASKEDIDCMLLGKNSTDIRACTSK